MQLGVGTNQGGFRSFLPAALKKVLEIMEMGRALRRLDLIMRADQHNFAGEIAGVGRILRKAGSTVGVELHCPAVYG
jgi:hypothetical protein